MRAFSFIVCKFVTQLYLKHMAASDAMTAISIDQ